jgi:hypothetical protein
MTLKLPHVVQDIPLPFLIVCDGYSDACLIDEILQHYHISNCNVGCPSDRFRPNLPAYLKALKSVMDIRARQVQGLLVIVDADESPKSAFNMARKAMRDGGFPAPKNPFTLEDLNPRVAVYLIPGKDREGTLEHLLLEAAYKKRPKSAKCVEKFLACVGRVKCSSNKDAKMRLSALVGASCSGNPWASAALIWSDKRNPVPINSPCFKQLVSFLRKFSNA